MVTFTINIPQMLAYIPAPWILWDIYIAFTCHIPVGIEECRCCFLAWCLRSGLASISDPLRRTRYPQVMAIEWENNMGKHMGNDIRETLKYNTFELGKHYGTILELGKHDFQYVYWIGCTNICQHYYINDMIKPYCQTRQFHVFSIPFCWICSTCSKKFYRNLTLR